MLRVYNFGSYMCDTPPIPYPYYFKGLPDKYPAGTVGYLKDGGLVGVASDGPFKDAIETMLRKQHAGLEVISAEEFSRMWQAEKMERWDVCIQIWIVHALNREERAAA